MEKTIVITRGIPGSGKSTFSKMLGTKAICCADDYFEHRGEYIWHPDKIGAAHEWCQRKCGRFMQKGIERIVIANTSTTEKEMQPYVDLAKRFGYKIFYIVVENRHGGTNEHGVPQAALDKMKNRFEISL